MSRVFRRFFLRSRFAVRSRLAMQICLAAGLAAGLTGSIITPAHASSDMGCVMPMTAHLQTGQNEFCVFGIGNAVLNPANDSKINLLLLMLQPAADQHVNLDNLWFWDAAGEPLLSPFQISAVQAGDPVAVKQVAQQRFQTFTDLLTAIEPDATQRETLTNKLNEYLQAPALSAEAERLLSFNAQLLQEKELDDADRLRLLRNRLGISAEEPQSAVGKEYYAYVNAANTFHQGEYAVADTAFSTLQPSNVDWIRETALYNRIRVSIRLAQLGADDEYGFFDLTKVDPEQAGKIVPAIDAYLTQYSAGRYTQSARQLKRRAYWLAGNHDALLAEYDETMRAVRSANAVSAAVQLAEEIDDKVLFPDYAATQPDAATGLAPATAVIRWQNPALAATQVLLRLRKPAWENARYVPVPVEDLKAHEADFTTAGAQSIYQFLLLADLFYHQEKWDAVIAASADWEQGLAQGDYAAFSRAALRLQALQKLQRFDEANALVVRLRQLAPSPLLKDHFELAQAQLLESTGQLAKVFAADSDIRSATIRRRLLRGSADATLLRQVVDQPHIAAEEKSVALATLLKKALFSRQYSPLLEYQKQYAKLTLPDSDGLAFLRDDTIAAEQGFKCPAWSAVLADLTQPQPTPRSALCLGERLRTLEDNGIQPYVAPADELGNGADGFGKKDLARLALYLPLIGNPAAAGEDEAFALRRALYCYATSGYNHCGSEDIPPEQRKGWFTRLKNTYKQSTWAQQQKYYW